MRPTLPVSSRLFYVFCVDDFSSVEETCRVTFGVAVLAAEVVKEGVMSSNALVRLSVHSG